MEILVLLWRYSGVDKRGVRVYSRMVKLSLEGSVVFSEVFDFGFFWVDRGWSY